MDTDNNFLFQETLRTQEDKVLDCNKRKDWRKKKYSLFVVDSCSGGLATLATATALPVPPAILIISYCSIALNFGYDFVLLVHFLGHPVCTHKHKNANTPSYKQTSVPPN